MTIILCRKIEECLSLIESSMEKVFNDIKGKEEEYI